MSRSIVAVIIAAGLLGIFLYFQNAPSGEPSPVAGQAEEQMVRGRVEAFGETFKMVPLLAPTSTFEAALDQYYGEFVAPELLASWKANHMLAPGRETSSPWPDHAMVDSILKQTDASYRVIVNEVLLTSATSTPVALQPIYMRLQKQGDKWMVVELQKDPYTED